MVLGYHRSQLLKSHLHHMSMLENPLMRIHHCMQMYIHYCSCYHLCMMVFAHHLAYLQQDKLWLFEHNKIEGLSSDKTFRLRRIFKFANHLKQKSTKLNLRVKKIIIPNGYGRGLHKLEYNLFNLCL